MKKFIIVAFLAIANPCHAWDDWEPHHKGLQMAYTTLHLVDWAQTKWIANKSNGKHEVIINQLIGRHPKHNDVDAYFLITLIGHYLISDYLQEDNRTTWQLFTIGMEFKVTYNNFQIGIGLNF